MRRQQSSTALSMRMENIRPGTAQTGMMDLTIGKAAREAGGNLETTRFYQRRGLTSTKVVAEARNRDDRQCSIWELGSHLVFAAPCPRVLGRCSERSEASKTV